MNTRPASSLGDGKPGYRPLARRYARWISGVTMTLLLALGSLESYFGYRESLDHIETTQALQAKQAAFELSVYLSTIESALRDVGRVAWDSPGFKRDQRREEFYRHLRMVPATTELRAVDKHGHERLRVSRTSPDQFDTGQLIEEPELAMVSPEQGIRFGKTFFRNDELPTLHVSAVDGDGAIVATVDLRLLGDVVARLGSVDGGLAYVVDPRGVLIAHPMPTLVLARPDLSGSEAVRAIQAMPAGSGGGGVRALFTRDIAGHPVIVTGTRITGPDWTVFIEQQRSEALKPAVATLTRTLLFMCLGIIAALFAGVTFSRQLAAPIVALRQATARIAAGDLETKLVVSRHDEIEDLAGDFNQMVRRLRDVYESLEAKVADRTEELSHARDVLAERSEEIEGLNQRLVLQLDELLHRKDEAERANAAKTRFLAAASHDLRQPMHSISLLLGVLQSRLDSLEHVALADKIQSSVATMESLFGNLLDISKLDAGAVQAHVEDVDLGWLLHRLEQTWAPQAAEKGLKLSVRACNVVVRGDAVLLERIVGNLVANAIRYTRRGGVLVGCRRRGTLVELQVWDSGPGIDPRYREAIFEEFFRIEAPGSGQEKGLGLGLSIVQRCAQILGYRLSVDSRVARGTVFRLQLPLSAATAASPRSSPRLAASQQALTGRFIVVVDDDATNAQALVDALHACRCHVVAAASCDEVLAELHQHLRVPDLIVTDYQLVGGRNGFEVISRLRQHYDEAIPALMITANTDAGLQPRAAAQNARLLHKPIGLQRLLDAMLESLSP